MSVKNNILIPTPMECPNCCNTVILAVAPNMDYPGGRNRRCPLCNVAVRVTYGENLYRLDVDRDEEPIFELELRED